MYIKRLEIAGFKSFTDKAVVPFGPGISAVVGPNGCGKSNIIDAIRWVMGEQSPRYLRARNMEDLLFNGSQGRAPAALAEVTLTMARELDPGRGLAEVAVTRRLYRSGDSEYLINRIPHRLKDVIRFFIEVGVGTRAYAIIEQERVGRLVDARPEDRRQLIDEAAGITRFKEQKKESERKIEGAEQNLTAVSALMAETKKLLGSVSRAAAKASVYQNIKNQLRDMDLALSARRFLELTDRQKNLSAESEALRDSLVFIIGEASQAELEVETLRLEENEAELRLEEELGHWHKLEAGFQGLQREVEHVGEALSAALRQKEKSHSELLELNDDRGRRQAEEESLKEQMRVLEAENAEAVETRNNIREEWQTLKSDTDRLIENRDRTARDLSGVRESLGRLNETLAGADSLLEHLVERKRSMELEQNQGGQNLERAREKLNSLERFKKDLEDDLAQAQDEIENKREDSQAVKLSLEEKLRELGLAESRLAALRARLETLEGLKAGFGWYPEGVKALMNEPTLLENGLLGPLAETLGIPEGYEAAAEAALGERLAWLLVRDRKAGLLALKYAQDHSLGRVGFVSQKDLGEKLDSALLGDFSLADVLDEEKMTEGIWLTRDGAYLGETHLAGGGGTENAADSGLLARLREVGETETLVEGARKVLDVLKAEVADLRDELNQAEEALAVAESVRNNLMSDLSENGSKIMVAKSEENGLVIRQNSLTNEIKKVLEDTEACVLKKEIAQKEKEKLFEESLRLEEVYQTALSEATAQADTLEELKERGLVASSNADSTGERLESAGRELARVSEWLSSLSTRRDDLTRETERLSGEIERLSERQAQLAREMTGRPEEMAEAERRVSALREARSGGREKIQRKEETAREARKKREDSAGKLNVLERDLLDTSYSLGTLNDNLLKDWRVVIHDSLAPVPDGLEAEIGAMDSALMPDETTGETEEKLAGVGENEQSDETEVAQTGEADKTEEVELAEEAGYSVPLAPPEKLDLHEWSKKELPDDAELLCEKLKNRIASMGEINLAAIGEEAELTARYNFQKEQYEDLTKALTDLKDGIARINQTCRKRFSETFQEVDQKFREIFPVLFEGGEGWLGLTDESDPLESGVEIHVHPPGKKIMVMSLLSGGEKALTALALIFALYLIKPSPFCLLDEADAPLDEANIDRFNRLLQRLSSASQIIMVTHNKRTMQISGTMYGVTMETPGVSRLVSVNLAEAEAFTDA